MYVLVITHQNTLTSLEGFCKVCNILSPVAIIAGLWSVFSSYDKQDFGVTVGTAAPFEFRI